MTWEQRYHPLRDEWVVVAGHRQHRPWQGKLQGERVDPQPSYVAGCYLCPGNARVHGANPSYTNVFAFDNDHPCVAADAPEPEPAPGPDLGVHVARRAEGVSRVAAGAPCRCWRAPKLCRGCSACPKTAPSGRGVRRACSWGRRPEPRWCRRAP